MSQAAIVRLFSLATGMALGGALPALATRRTPAGERGHAWADLLLMGLESVGTMAACLLGALAFAGQPLEAVTYAGLGAVLGTAYPLWKDRPMPPVHGLAAASIWLCLSLPFTGMLCCVAGYALAVLLLQPRLALPVMALTAIPTSLLQFGAERAALAGLVTVLAVGRLLRRFPHRLTR